VNQGPICAANERRGPRRPRFSLKSEASAPVRPARHTATVRLHVASPGPVDRQSLLKIEEDSNLL